MQLDLSIQKIQNAKLAAFGFAKAGRCWRLERPLGFGDLSLVAEVKAGKAECRVFDESGEEYVLHQIPEAKGAFVGGVQAAIEDFRQKFIAECCAREEFHTRAAKALLAEAESCFGEKPEFLWDNAPRCAVLRRADTGKWYAVFMVVPASKLGLPYDEEIEIVDMRVPESGISFDGSRYFPGWHMNKTTWFSAVLDGPVSSKELVMLMMESRERATGR